MKRLPYTPASRIRNAIRIIWLRSRERSHAMKNAGYCCERCGVHQSVAKGSEVKLQVHHKRGIDWDGVIAFLRERVLQTPEDLEVLCDGCHGREHNTGSHRTAPAAGDVTVK